MSEITLTALELLVLSEITLTALKLLVLSGILLTLLELLVSSEITLQHPSTGSRHPSSRRKVPENDAWSVIMLKPLELLAVNHVTLKLLEFMVLNGIMLMRLEP